MRPIDRRSPPPWTATSTSYVPVIGNAGLVGIVARVDILRGIINEEAASAGDGA